MTRLFLFFFLSIFLLTQQFQAKGNFLTKFTDTELQIISKSRYGWTFFAISKSNSTFANAFCILVWKPTDGDMIFVRVKPGNLTKLPTELILDDDVSNIYGYKDLTDYPYSSFPNQQNWILGFNSTFDFPFYFYMATNKQNLPVIFNETEVTYDSTLDEEAWFYIENRTDYTQYFPLPRHRLETLHPSIFGITLGYFVLIFLSLFFFFRFQPLKSRGILPFFATIAQILYLLPDILIYAGTIEIWEKWYCGLSIFFQQPIFLCLLTLNLIQFARYILLLLLQRAKHYIIQNKESTIPKSFSYSMKLLLLLNNPLFHIIFIVLYYAFIVTISLIIYFTNGQSCIKTIAFDVIFNLISLLIILSFIILAIVDFVLFLPKCRNNGICTFWKEDTLFFKVQLYLIGIPLLLLDQTLLWTSFSLVPFNPILESISTTYTFHSLFFFQVLFVLIVTIIKLIYGCFKKPQCNESIGEIFNDPRKRELFFNYCQYELSTENFSCYEDIQKYKKLSEDKRKKFIEFMYSMYFNQSQSLLEVNIARKHCDKILIALFEEKFPDRLLHDIEVSIIANLSDTYSRFVFEPQYYKLIKVETHLDKLMKN